MIVLSILLSLIFLVLAIVHLNWAIGNTWGLSHALPTKADGELVMNPGTFATLAVALGLLLCTFFYFINPEPGNPNNWIFDWGRLLIPIAFLLRAIGDFRYVGLFKKVKNTKFGKMDSKLFTPICVVIAILGLLVKFL